MAGPCKNCGNPVAPFGYRRRGMLRDLPEGKRTMIFVCDAPECRARAEAWKAKADGVARLPPRPRNDDTPQTSPKANSAQGSLF